MQGNLRGSGVPEGTLPSGNGWTLVASFICCLLCGCVCLELFGIDSSRRTVHLEDKNSFPSGTSFYLMV